MKTATIVILVIALTLTVAGGAILIGAQYYASVNGITPLQAVRGIADVRVGDDGVHVGAGPVTVDVDEIEDSVNVRIGPFNLNVDDSGVSFNGREYDGGRSRGLWSWGYSSFTPEYYDNPLERTLSIDGVDYIKVSLIARDIEIIQGSGSGSITLFERYEGEFSSFDLINGRLTVEVNDQKTDIKGGFWNRSNRLAGDMAKVRLVLPAGALPDIRIDTVSGEVLLEGVSATGVNIGNVSGGITASDCGFESTEIYSVSGALTIGGGSLGRARLESVSGGIEVRGAELADLHAEQINGRIEMELPGAESDYRFEFESVSGRFELGGSSYRGGSRIGGGDINISLETVSGDAEIHIK